MDVVKEVVDPVELAHSLIANGDALLSDAAYLLDDGRTTRAAALVVIALEEFSKVRFCLDAITGDEQVPAASSMLWRSHSEKLSNARAFEIGFLDAEPDFDTDRAQAEVRSLVRLKMSSLYVDHDESGIVRPDALVTDVQPLIERGLGTSRLLHAFLDPVTPEVMQALDPVKGLFRVLVDAFVDDTNPAASVARLRSIAAMVLRNDSRAAEHPVAELFDAPT